MASLEKAESDDPGVMVVKKGKGSTRLVLELSLLTRMVQLDLVSPMAMSISNLVTAESRRLPRGGNWEFVIDDDDKQASLVQPKHAFDTGDDELDFTIIDIDEFLIQQVFQSANGERYIVQGNQE